MCSKRAFFKLLEVEDEVWAGPGFLCFWHIPIQFHTPWPISCIFIIFAFLFYFWLWYFIFKYKKCSKNIFMIFFTCLESWHDALQVCCCKFLMKVKESGPMLDNGKRAFCSCFKTGWRLKKIDLGWAWVLFFCLHPYFPHTPPWPILLYFFIIFDFFFLFLTCYFLPKYKKI